MFDVDDFRQFAGPVRSPSIEETADRAAVTQLVKIYALGIDMRDLDVVRSVFADDAFVDGSVGAMAASEYLPRVFEGASAYAATQHNITNQHVVVDGDDAFVWSYAVAVHIQRPESEGDDLVLGVHYRDRCRRFPEGWMITYRKTSIAWARGPFPARD
jgi:ketosteroid isomerase-like protein